MFREIKFILCIIATLAGFSAAAGPTDLERLLPHLAPTQFKGISEEYEAIRLRLEGELAQAEIQLQITSRSYNESKQKLERILKTNRATHVIFEFQKQELANIEKTQQQEVSARDQKVSAAKALVEEKKSLLAKSYTDFQEKLKKLLPAIRTEALELLEQYDRNPWISTKMGLWVAHELGERQLRLSREFNALLSPETRVVIPEDKRRETSAVLRDVWMTHVAFLILQEREFWGHFYIAQEHALLAALLSPLSAVLVGGINAYLTCPMGLVALGCWIAVIGHKDINKTLSDRNSRRDARDLLTSYRAGAGIAPQGCSAELESIWVVSRLPLAD